MGIVFTALVGVAVLAALINPVWGLCAYIATIVIRPNEIVEGVMVPAVPVMFLVMSLAYAIHFGRITLPTKDAPPHRSPPLLSAMVGLLIVHFLIFPSGVPLKDWFLGEFAPTILLLLYMTRHITTPGRLHAALTTTTASAAVIALDALKVHFLRKGGPEEAETPQGVIYTGYGTTWNNYHLHGLRLMGRNGTVWGNPNDLGMVTNWALLGCLFYLKRKGSKALKLCCVGLMGLLAATLFLTGSRGGQLQLGINLWMVFVGGKRKALGIFLLVFALAGALVVLPRLAPQRSDAGASKDERTELLLAGYRLFKAYPVQGCGYLKFAQENDFKSLFPHNVYVQSLAETGLIGSGIFFAMMFLIRRETKTAVRYFLGGTDVNAAVLAQCIGALQLSFSVFILFSNQFMTYRLGLVMTLAMALFRTMGQHLAQHSAAADQAASAARSGDDRPPQAGLASEAQVVDQAPPRRRPRRSTMATPTADPGPAQDSPRRPRRRTRASELSAPVKALPPRTDIAAAPDPEPEPSPPRPRRESKYVFDPRAPQAGVQQRDVKPEPPEQLPPDEDPADGDQQP